MPSFKQRSAQKELLDGTGVPFADIKQNMQELNVINHRLGGHKITIAGFKNLIKPLPGNETVRVVEIGCGGGDNLRVIKKWAAKKGVSLQLTGIDINPECIAFAQEQEANAGISFICSDYKKVKFQQLPHIIFSSLFCHHFTDKELIPMLQWLQQNSSRGFFINDLHRHPLAYYSIKFLTKLFSKSYLVKNDAPLSVERSFVKKDWINLLSAAGLKQYTLQWKWAFRWLVIAVT
jgi:2-polyprenyl-3-methyl-5-hydroxy-6-metoxy-1,4-benzoquinol methylase